uniref:Putative serine/threonine-protein kinase ddb g0267686 s n=1 Tax=Xenopsylla cheopis TaxID=163159 RepID=A0A6M2DQ17_XENCH
MADNICSPITPNSTVKKNQKASSHNVINLTTSESLRISGSELDQQLSSGPESGVFLSHSTPNSRNVNKGGSSFQITSVITGSRMSNGEDSEEDYSRLTDFENETPSYSEDTISKEDVDVFLYNKQAANLQNVGMSMVLQPPISLQEHIQKNAHEAMQEYDINIKVPTINYGNNLNLNLDSTVAQKASPNKPITLNNDADEVVDDTTKDKDLKVHLENALNYKTHNDTNVSNDSQFSSKDSTLTQDIIHTVENAFSKDINTSVENINNIKHNDLVENVISKHNDINVNNNVANNIPARTDRFKVVKIESTEPFKRGRWVCMDYLDKNEYNAEGVTNNHSNANINKLYEKNDMQEGDNDSGSKMGSPVKDIKLIHQNNNMAHHQSLTPQQMMQCLSTNKNINMTMNQDNANVQGQSMPTEFFNDKYANQQANVMSSSTGPPVSMSNQHNENITQYYTGQVQVSSTNNMNIPLASQAPAQAQAPAPAPAPGASLPNIQTMTNAQQGMSLPTNMAQQVINQQALNINPSGINITNRPMINHASGANTEAIAREKLLEAVVIVGSSNSGSTEDGDSTGTTNAVAIDNKIEQAMDLVKSHLMFAVREEVEVLKEKISELMERINMLELENGILRAHATQETLAQLKSNATPPTTTPVVPNPTTTPGITPNTNVTSGSVSAAPTVVQPIVMQQPVLNSAGQTGATTGTVAANNTGVVTNPQQNTNPRTGTSAPGQVQVQVQVQGSLPTNTSAS